MNNTPINQVLARYTPQLMSLPGVIGTGIGMCDGTPCIKIFAKDLSPKIKEKIPERLEGHPVKIERSDEFTVYD